MAPVYMLFDFGSDEQKAQQARHKLDVWKQAFRLDKKMTFKFERGNIAPSASEPFETLQAKGNGKEEKKTAVPQGTVKLLLRLGFSGHEKITEHHWTERIPSEEPFRSSSPHVIKQREPEFDATEKRFENLDRAHALAGGGHKLPG